VERHTTLDQNYHKYAPSECLNPKEWFEKAFQFGHEYYGSEITRASAVDFKKVSPSLFFSEYIWVVHATGFSAKAVSKFIERLSKAYGEYDTLSQKSIEEALMIVTPVVNNPPKIRAIWETSKLLNHGIILMGWEEFKNTKLNDLEKLQSLPYIGKVTKYHLGRNIGMLDCVKPDLHLVRLRKKFGYESEIEMIRDMSMGHELPLGIADMIAWYYASTFGTSHMKNKGDR